MYINFALILLFFVASLFDSSFEKGVDWVHPGVLAMFAGSGFIFALMASVLTWIFSLARERPRPSLRVFFLSGSLLNGILFCMGGLVAILAGRGISILFSGQAGSLMVWGDSFLMLAMLLGLSAGYFMGLRLFRIRWLES